MANYDVESHTHTEECFVLFCYFWHPMLVRPVMKRLFFLGKPREKRLTSLARLMINMNCDLIVFRRRYSSTCSWHRYVRTGVKYEQYSVVDNTYQSIIPWSIIHSHILAHSLGSTAVKFFPLSMRTNTHIKPVVRAIEVLSLIHI